MAGAAGLHVSAMRRSALLGYLVLLAACEEAEAPAEVQAAPDPPVPEANEGPPEAGPVPDDWVAARVSDARERMEATEGGRILLEAIEAHGGLSAWLSPGTVAFEYDYRPIDEPARRMHTDNHVDLWRARARQAEIEEPDDENPEATFGFDGERAWITPGPDAFPTPARFWATTPYYFVGIPFVLADPGARYERLEDAPLDGVDHRIVKVTYAEGTGDSPDDYYVIYLHPETHRVAAIRYIVAFPGFFPEGGHSPEKLMRYEDLREVDGRWLAHRFRTHTWDPEAETIGAVVTEISAGDYRFGQTWPAAHFAPPAGAAVSTSIGGE